MERETERHTDRDRHTRYRETQSERHTENVIPALVALLGRGVYVVVVGGGGGHIVERLWLHRYHRLLEEERDLLNNART